MKKDQNIRHDIQQYLSGGLNSEARNEFEKRLQEDPSLREAFGTEANVVEEFKDTHSKIC